MEGTMEQPGLVPRIIKYLFDLITVDTINKDNLEPYMDTIRKNKKNCSKFRTANNNNINGKSSRGHIVTFVDISEQSYGEVYKFTFNDLAGSENLKEITKTNRNKSDSTTLEMQGKYIAKTLPCVTDMMRKIQTNTNKKQLDVNINDFTKIFDFNYNSSTQLIFFITLNPTESEFKRCLSSMILTNMSLNKNQYTIEVSYFFSK